MLHALLAAALAVAPQQLDTTFAVRDAGKLQLENHQGAITVGSWNRAEMRIRARVAGDGRVEVDRSGSTVRVEARPRRGPVTVTYEITVPHRFDVAIEAINSSIDISNIQGRVDLETINGAVTVSEIRGAIRAESTQGRVRISGSSGDLRVETVNQGIDVIGHEGEIHAETVNGGIRLSGIRSRSVTAETVNGGVEYDGEILADGRYSLSTHNGGILLVVPTGTNADVAVETYRGEIDSEFPIEILGRSSARRDIKFTIGRGGAHIDLTSFGGNIRLRRPARR